MRSLIGRDRALADLWAALSDGRVVFLFGPVGIGKTSVMRALAERARRLRRPVAYAASTNGLADVTLALRDAYARDMGVAQHQRQIRGRIRMAVDRDPGVLLLDHVEFRGTAVKGFVRSIQGSGLGILLAADVDHPRDRERMRSLRLTHREYELEPLTRVQSLKVLRAALTESAPAHPVSEGITEELLRIANGRPGALHLLARKLADPTSWSDGNARLTKLRNDLVVESTERYLRPVR
jgi:replication-associated recombination protein RarA